MLSKELKEWNNTEHTFFEIDEEKKIAKVVLKYEKPEDILDGTFASDTPLISREAWDYIQNVFGLIPPKHKVDLSLCFDDPGSYTEEQLDDILKKNIKLELKTKLAATRKRDMLAVDFLLAGVLSFIFVFVLKRTWISNSMWHDLVIYVFDIVTTVSIYEAITILVLEKKEHLAVLKTIHDSFSEIHFEKSTD